MDKALLMFRSGGIRSVTRVLADGNEHSIFYKVRSPADLARFLGADEALGRDGDAAAERQKVRARFLAASLCEEDGSPLLSVEEAEKIPGTMKADLCSAIVAGSNDLGEAGKG